jgi:hypothetical protein
MEKLSYNQALDRIWDLDYSTVEDYDGECIKKVGEPVISFCRLLDKNGVEVSALKDCYKLPEDSLSKPDGYALNINNTEIKIHYDIESDYFSVHQFRHINLNTEEKYCIRHHCKKMLDSYKEDLQRRRRQAALDEINSYLEEV